MIPLCVNVIQYPQPTALRCFKLGQALRRAIDSYGPDIKVAVLGTVACRISCRERAGLINAPYDNQWLDDMVRDPLSLTRIGHTELLREAGSEGLEIAVFLSCAAQ